MTVTLTYSSDGTPVTSPTEVGQFDVAATIDNPNFQGSATGILRITTPPTLSVSDATMNEGDAGASNVVFMLRLSAAATVPVGVSFTTSDGTATVGADYAAATGTVTFNPGETTKNITVAVNGDALDEANETFKLILSAPTNATIADSMGVCTITDDD